MNTVNEDNQFDLNLNDVLPWEELEAQNQFQDVDFHQLSQISKSIFISGIDGAEDQQLLLQNRITHIHLIRKPSKNLPFRF